MPPAALSKDELAEIEHELSHYERPSAATIEALKIVQKHRGWVSDDAVRAIADRLQTSAADVDAVATFYNLIFRKPVGRHVIFVCDSMSCYVMGMDGLRAKLEKKLGIRYGQTTPDDRFTLLPICCLGTCDRAPALLIDRDTHRNLENLSEQSLDELLAGYP
ncbi:MAG TPA: NADH-quinone oxidoreductase subunit NuoE [Candidatus Binatia bacterium]|nr:NADH-quinone oxidoreductase subunit NuoE [Candidatus Binatia bacterium]